MNNVVRLPTTATMLARAHELHEDQGRAIAKIDWNARAAMKQLANGNLAAARRFVRHILATTTGQS